MTEDDSQTEMQKGTRGMMMSGVLIAAVLFVSLFAASALAVFG